MVEILKKLFYVIELCKAEKIDEALTCLFQSTTEELLAILGFITLIENFEVKENGRK